MKQKVAVVTGASRGIGAAAAVKFAGAGYDVVVNFRKDEKGALAVAAKVTDLGRKAYLVQADVSMEAGVTALATEVKRTVGQVDVLINNVGRPHESPFGEWDQASVIESLNGNVVSAILCSQAMVPLMRNGGSIVFVSSVYGLEMGGSPRSLLYSAGKAAVINFAQTLAERLAPHIRCNVVAPGTTRTPVWDNATSDYVDWKLKVNLQPEWVEPEEVAGAMLFLAETPHINAQTIVVDAGWQKRPVGTPPSHHRS